METVAVRSSKRQVGVDIQVAYDIRTCAIFFSGRASYGCAVFTPGIVPEFSFRTYVPFCKIRSYDVATGPVLFFS